MGVPKEIIDTLGINDLASIFINPPPGIDEIVALTKIFQYADEKGIFIVIYIFYLFFFYTSIVFLINRSTLLFIVPAVNLFCL